MMENVDDSSRLGDDEESKGPNVNSEVFTNEYITASRIGVNRGAYDELDPPISTGEHVRDTLLRMLDRPVFHVMGIVVLLLIIVDGAAFFFLLVGWHPLCRPRTDCDPRNWWYNFSVQVLTVLVTYMAAISFPWRFTNWVHVVGWGCPRRNNAVGLDLFGLPTTDIWFHIPLPTRSKIILLLLMSSLSQFANQATRIRYYTFEKQDEFPGNFWTSIFIVLSLLLALTGGVWVSIETSRVRKTNPRKFGPGPVVAIKNTVRGYFSTAGKTEESDIPQTPSSSVAGTEYAGADSSAPSERNSQLSLDPTRDPNPISISCNQRSCMRLFAM